MNLYASVYFLTALSVDRYFSVCYPIISRKIRSDTACDHLWHFCCWLDGALKLYRSQSESEFDASLWMYKKWSRKSIHDLLLCSHGCWLLSYQFPLSNFELFAILAATKLQIKNLWVATWKYYLQESYSIQYCMWSFTYSQSRWFLASKILLGYLVPLCIIVYCYIAIICKVRRSETTACSSGGNHAEKTQKVVVIIITAMDPKFSVIFSIIFFRNDKLNPTLSILFHVATKSCIYDG